MLQNTMHRPVRERRHLSVLQEWRYKNAVRVDAEEAARHGLQAGALVLESTLAGTPSSSPDASAERQQSPAQDATVSMFASKQCCLCMLSLITVAGQDAALI